MGKPLLKENEVPSGGIADFIMTSDEIKQIEALEAREQFGDSGIANFEEVASRMSSYGRFGDDTVAHLQKGEIIVPKALIEQNPVLKESIFNHLKELGIEDPERYVVGSSANSINPDTGMPEFFLGKILKGVKNIFKKVGKVLKKAAPIIGSILLTPILGPAYGPMVGTGIGSLIQGKSPKDALKSALMTGAFTALGAGLRSRIGGGGFFAGVGKALDPRNLGFKAIGEKTSSALSNLADPKKIISDNFPVVEPTTESSSNFFSKTKDLFFPAGPTKTAIDAKVAELSTLDAYKNLTSKELLDVATKELQPSFLRKYGPLAAAGTGIMAAGGMFTAPKDEEVEYTTGQQLLEENPEKYTLDPEAYKLKYLTNQDFGIPTQYASTAYVDQINNPFLNPQFQQPVQNVKHGGEIFPRRTGGIAPDEGVAGKDSVRAMLMPGEFVMTTNAVKGMGNGDLNQGINNMYGMMRNLENRGRMMA